MAKLYIIPTPIGNLEDITLRAIRILKEADLILAEDTRTTAYLLKHYGIETPMKSHHLFNEHRFVPQFVERILSGETIAVVSDAGTPGISDPGFLIVRECIKQGVEVECLPGATAFVPALVSSGLPCDCFHFEGFLPPKKGRQTRLKILAEMPHTIVLYESPHRLVKSLEEFILYFGPERKGSVARELTKMHEEIKRGTLPEILEHYKLKPAIKGEIVIVIEGKGK
jgi:16S rRNA (cytidine1402-2'-O)-methyltransferase